MTVEELAVGAVREKDSGPQALEFSNWKAIYGMNFPTIITSSGMVWLSLH